MPLLVTLTKYKAAIGETSAANDGKHTEAIEDASAAILGWSDRDWGEAQVTEDRTYRYDGSGFLEIDDADTINSVTLDGALLAEESWYAGKDGPTAIPVYSYLELPPYSEESGEMGFTRNLDVWLRRTRQTPYVDVVVNAQWGWPVVPDDVQRATIWAAASFEAATPDSTGAGEITGEAVAEVSRTYLAMQGLDEATNPLDEEPLPRRVRGLLYPYQRHVL